MYQADPVSEYTPRISGEFLKDLMESDIPELERTTLNFFLEDGLSMSEAAQNALKLSGQDGNPDRAQDLCRRTMARIRHIGYHDPLYEAFIR